MYALCVSGAVNTRFWVDVFLCAIYKFSFIHSFSFGFCQSNTDIVTHRHFMCKQTDKPQKAKWMVRGGGGEEDCL